MDLFSEKPRKIYVKNPIVQVICQLRFPTILRINVEQPYKFQDAIRKKGFPIYFADEEKLETNLLCDNSSDSSNRIINNYYFYSENKSRQVNLTSNFIAFAVNKVEGQPAYTNWSDFKDFFYPILTEFEKEYDPSYYDRVGLRYIDAIDKKSLFKTEYKWKDLFYPHVLGILNATDLTQEQVLSCGSDSLIKLGSNIENRYLKLHTGLGKLKDNDDIHFIIDSDFYSDIKTEIHDAKETLEYLHQYSGKFARGCFKARLDSALGEIK